MYFWLIIRISANAIMNLPKGHRLQKGKYQLGQVIGQGGFGITYKGIWFTEVKGNLGTVQTEVPVCIKEYFFKDYCDRDPQSLKISVHSETGKQLFNKFKEKLIKEATILSEVHHPHIVNVLEVFEENNTAYIAMEYIPGDSLKQILDKRGVLTETEVLRYISQTGSALDFVHRKSILHLDIKPSNILVDKNGDARLIDFGVSKRYDIEQQETSTTMLTLSKGFASIEQYDDEGTQQFSPCPDIYSLGATIYNLLTGKLPIESILRATKPLPDVLELNPELSERTAGAIRKAMEIKPADRFQSVRELLEALELPEPEEVEETTVLPLNKINHTETTPPAPTPSEADEDDQTIVYSKDQQEKQIPRTNRKRKWVAASLLLLVIIGASATFLLRNQESSSGQNPSLIADNKSNAALVADDLTAIPPLTPQDSTADAATNQPDAKEKGREGLPESNANATIPSNYSPVVNTRSDVSPQIKTGNEPDAVPSLSPELQYNSLLSSGKEKEKKGDLTGAKQDYNAAKEALLTEEIVRLCDSIEEKIEEKTIANRKAQYEQKMPFGQYMIVRKKDTGKYGAIDNAGNERIPCKYLYPGLTKGGRAFEREDGLFDIYGTDGKLIKEAQISY